MNPEPEELKDALSRTHADLERSLEEACDDQDIAQENTGELIRLEEVLNDAASSAKKAISLRRRLSAERTKRGQGGVGSDRVATDRGGGAESEKIREVVDASGGGWRVWEVPPEQLDRTRPGAYAGDFEKGWLCFESATGQERRRLPSYPSNWRSLPAPKLLGLLEEAKPVPARRRRGGAQEEGGEA